MRSDRPRGNIAGSAWPILRPLRYRSRLLQFMVRPALLAAVVLALTSCNGSARVPEFSQAIPVRPVRVKLAEDIKVLYLSVTGPYQITDDDGQILLQSSSFEPFTVGQAGGQILIDSRFMSQRSLYLKPSGFGCVQVNGKKYRGYMRLLINRNSSLLLINHVPLEDYVASVIGGEMPPYFHPEAFCAQAVAARTYVLHRMLNNNREDWDVGATAASQVYSGLSSENDITQKAQHHTRGQILVYRRNGQAEVICAFYSSTCGGATQPVSALNKNFEDIPPLAGIRESFCQDSPKYHWETRVWTKAKLQQTLAAGSPGSPQLGPMASLTITRRTELGRPREITVTDQQSNSLVLGAEELRTKLSLPSSWFDLEDHGQEIWFTHGRGWGHGVGMCQYGANHMAQLGYSYKQILDTYYPEAELVNCY